MYIYVLLPFVLHKIHDESCGMEFDCNDDKLHTKIVEAHLPGKKEKYEIEIRIKIT